MLNEVSCLVIGLWVGAAVGVLFTIALFYTKLAKKDREIGKLKALLTVKEILTPVFTNLVKSVLDPFLEMITKTGEKKK